MPQDAEPIRRSAIVLLALGAEQADQILRRLSPQAVKQVTRELAKARDAGPPERLAALELFVRAAGIEEVLPSSSPFAELRDAETQTLLDSIRDEHPQTIALVLAHLPADKASDVLAGVSQSKQVEVVKRIAGIEQISAGVIEQVERGLRQRLGHVMGRTIRAGGVSAVAEILNFTDRRVEHEILESLQADAPHLAEQIRRVQAIFEQLLHVRDQDMLTVLDQLDHETISLALRTAREQLKRKVLRNLPQDEAKIIEGELQSVEPVHISEIESAQQRVAEVVHRLDAAGEIDLMSSAHRALRTKGT